MWKKIALGVFVLIVLAAIFGQENDNTNSTDAVTNANTSSKTATTTANYLNEPVKGRYFKVTVLGASETSSPPVEFVCEKAPSGSRYVMVDMKIENTDSESRSLLTEGELKVMNDGKWITYDQTETCTLGQEGFLNFLDDVGPFVVKQGKITFIVPDRFAVNDLVYLTPRDEKEVNLKPR